MIRFAHLSQCTSWLRPGGNDFQSLNLISRKALSEIVFRHLAQSGARKWLKISDFDFKFNAKLMESILSASDQYIENFSQTPDVG